MKYILGCICWCVALGLHAQQISIFDGVTQEPLEGVTVSQGQRMAWTNQSGQAFLEDFDRKENIYIQYLGYHHESYSFDQLDSLSFSIFLEPRAFRMNEVVVAASKWRQSSQNVPVKIITVDQEEVAFQNTQTAADLLGLSGKVFIQKSQQGGGSPMIRGFATNRLIYVVDGVRMNTAIFRGGNIQNVINLDPFATDHTEVLFGPSSVIYGSDAIGGVMSFNTLEAQLSQSEKMEISGKIQGRFSSANQEKTGHGHIRLAGQKWSSVTSFSHWDYGHLRQGSHGPTDYLKTTYANFEDSTDVVVQQEDDLVQRPSAYHQSNLMQKLRYQPNDQWNVEYGYHYSRTSAYGRFDRHNRTRNGLPRYGEWSYGPQSWDMHLLNTTWSPDFNLFDQASLRLSYQQFEESRWTRNFGSLERQIRTEQVDAPAINMDFIKSSSSRMSWFYGLEWVSNQVNSEGVTENIETRMRSQGSSRYPDAEWTSYSAYIQGEYKWNPSMVLQGGLRYTMYHLYTDFSENLEFFPLPVLESDIMDGALTGSLGVVFRPREDWVLKAKLGTAFRSPNVDDKGKIFDSEPGAVVVPNTDLQAEYVYSADVSFAKIFGDRLKIDVALYYNLLDDALVRRPFQLAGQDSIEYDGVLSQVQAVQNAAQARIFGVQFGFEYKFSPTWSLSTDVNYQKGEEELDDGSISPSRHAPPFFGTARLRWKRNKWQVEANTVFQGERPHEDLAFDERQKTEIYALDRSGRTYSPSWYTLNLKSQFQVMDNFVLRAGLENITDQRYRPYSSGISGPGFNMVISAEVKW